MTTTSAASTCSSLLAMLGPNRTYVVRYVVAPATTLAAVSSRRGQVWHSHLLAAFAVGS